MTLEHANNPVVLLNQDPGAETHRTFEIRGLAESLLAHLREAPPTPEEWAQLLSVFVVPATSGPDADSLPMWGSYRVEPELIRFLPLYPLVEGQRYCVRWQGAAPLDTYFLLPRAERPSPQVLRIYPSASELPENLLRFYVYFSQPMREGQASARIRLYERAGTEQTSESEPESDRELESVFLDPVEELWDASQTRLTVILDPARVKSGLAAHSALGRALRPGRRYQLEIAAGWRDAHGGLLRAAFSKEFRATAAQVTPPEVSLPQLRVPTAGTRDPLTLCFPNAMDHVLLAAFLSIRDASGRRRTGEVSLDQKESRWHFVPDTPWETGRHTLGVDTRLEDIAGNNMQGRFDRPADEPRAQNRQAPTITLPFDLPAPDQIPTPE